ncbi:MAG: hypothetical protein D6696_17660, partial [Acidobacteria bacterium]
PATPALDPRALDSLRTLVLHDGGTMLDRLVDSQLAQAPLERIEEALAAGDAAAVASTAHSAKGSLGFLGAAALAARYAEIEQRAKAGDLEACARLARALAPEQQRFERALRQLHAEPEEGPPPSGATSREIER